MPSFHSNSFYSLSSLTPIKSLKIRRGIKKGINDVYNGSKYLFYRSSVGREKKKDIKESRPLPAFLCFVEQYSFGPCFSLHTGLCLPAA